MRGVWYATPAEEVKEVGSDLKEVLRRAIKDAL